MSNKETTSVHQRWARLRFSVIGSLLSSPPQKGELRPALIKLSQQQWIHPITSEPMYFGLSTIERWFYKARKSIDPFGALRSKRRADAGKQKVLTVALGQAIRTQYQAHKSWSYQLHADNIKVIAEDNLAFGAAPSYSTLKRYMKNNGLTKQRRTVRRHTEGAQAAAKRLESREVRSYEVDYVHSLWHLDFHHGSRQILMPDGRWIKPMLLAIMDDRSRVICHAQWYLDETTESLVHGLSQAIQKRELPRALMTDNGAAMTSEEFTTGLERLSILQQKTLPYSPYQNAKQEFFWTHIEGRLMAMLENEREITLKLLNVATQAWVEQEYHHKFHSELNCTPIQRYVADKQVGRESPSSDQLRNAFRLQAKRKQRRSDGTISLDGQRFEVPSQYRHLEYIHVHYARWDLRRVDLINKDDNSVLCRLYPLDKSSNASGIRRTLNHDALLDESVPENTGIAPLLKKHMEDYAATGLPPAYIPTSDNNKHNTKEER